MSREDDLRNLRETLLGDATLRAGSEAVIDGILVELVGVDDDEEAPAWTQDRDLRPVPLTVGELRTALRRTLGDIAAAEGAS